SFRCCRCASLSVPLPLYRQPSRGISALRAKGSVSLCHPAMGSIGPLKILGVQRDGWIVGHVDPDVDVRLAPEIPDERRTFQTPVVPFAVVADIAFLVEGQAARIQAALLFHAILHLVLILFAVRLDQA